MSEYICGAFSANTSVCYFKHVVKAKWGEEGGGGGGDSNHVLLLF